MSSEKDISKLTRAKAKKLGWTLKIKNLGPPDWVHYGAFIYFGDETQSRVFLMDGKFMWDRKDALTAALEWIEQYESSKFNEETV